MVMLPEKLPGKQLGLSDIKNGKVIVTRNKPRLEYAWDAGMAIGRYLEELKNGRLIGKKCNKCGRIMIPPRMFCELCFRPSDEWVYLKDTGRVNTYSVCYVNWDASRVEEPFLPAVIEIDGASEGMGIMHLLGEVKPDEIKIGMAVQAVWKPAGEREGAITDIRYFKPMV
ncbi:MAG: Zn-ribbon domain-containing OB-fold protein, partial [bacterium]